MFEYFCRIALLATTDPEGVSNSEEREMLDTVRSLLPNHWEPLTGDRLCRGEIVHLNGNNVLVAMGGQNRDRGTTQELVELAESIGKIAPGSYGFIYVLDLDITTGWTVHTLVRGTVTEHVDPWFSPLCPTVDDIGA